MPNEEVSFENTLKKVGVAATKSKYQELKKKKKSPFLAFPPRGSPRNKLIEQLVRQR